MARIDTDTVVEQVRHSLAAGRGGWLVTANVDFVQRAEQSASNRALYSEADLIVADGAPLVWAAWLLGQPVPERCAGADLVWRLAEMAETNERTLYLVGGEGRSAEVAADRLMRELPGLRLVGHASPQISIPPTAEELAKLSEELHTARPDLVYVALGSPKQELVIRELRDELPQTWWMGCGISLSFVAGHVARAPRWVQRIGLEWLHRLLQEPRRLSGRYLRWNLPFTARLLLASWRAGRDRQDATRP